MSTSIQQKIFLIVFVGVISYISLATSWRSCVGPMCRAYRYDRGYVKPHCSDLIVYPLNDLSSVSEYRFEYSDSNSFHTHELGTTVTLTCGVNTLRDGDVVGYTENINRIEKLRRERGLTATCSKVNGQYTWTKRGQIVHYVDCTGYFPYCGPKPKDWSAEQA